MEHHGRSVLSATCTGLPLNHTGSGPFLADDTAVRTQYGALCWRLHRARVQFLLVTSRETRRWIIPKGWPMATRTPCEAAAIEAWEEAGVRGEVREDPLGAFGYLKVMTPILSVPCAVSVFGLRVTAVERRYPEQDERRRKWFPVEKAMRRVAEPELRALMLEFSERNGRRGPVASKAKGKSA